MEEKESYAPSEVIEFSKLYLEMNKDYWKCVELSKIKESSVSKVSSVQDRFFSSLDSFFNTIPENLKKVTPDLEKFKKVKNDLERLNILGKMDYQFPYRDYFIF